MFSVALNFGETPYENMAAIETSNHVLKQVTRQDVC